MTLLAVLFLCLLLPPINSQSSGITDAPVYKGPQNCSGSSDDTGRERLKGYVDTTHIQDDSFAQVYAAVVAAENGNVSIYQDEYVFQLCPNTTIDFGSNLETDDSQLQPAIVPFLHNMVIRCGENGDIKDNCVFRGGFVHVVFDDDFRVDNVTFAGISFEESSATSIFGYGHPYSDAFFVGCQWKNNVGKYLVELFWRPDLQFGIEFSDTNGTVEGDPEGGNERRRQRLRRLSRQEDRWVRGDVVEKIQNHLKMTFNKARGGESVSSEGSEGTGDHGSNPVASRDKGGQGRALLPEPTTPSMYALFYQCVIAHNDLLSAGIMNQGGIIELVGSTFEYNTAIAIIANTDGGIFLTHGDTRFANNQDLVGTVFVDKTSTVLINVQTEGYNNTGVVNQLESRCNGIFMEDESESCFPLQSADDLCDGFCCEFGNNECSAQKRNNKTDDVAPGKGGAATEFEQSGGSRTQPDDQAVISGPELSSSSSSGVNVLSVVIIVVIVVVSSVAVIAIGAVVYLLNKRKGGDPERAAEASEPDTTVTHSEQFQEEPTISLNDFA